MWNFNALTLSNKKDCIGQEHIMAKNFFFPLMGRGDWRLVKQIIDVFPYCPAWPASQIRPRQNTKKIHIKLNFNVWKRIFFSCWKYIQRNQVVLSNFFYFIGLYTSNPWFNISIMTCIPVKNFRSAPIWTPFLKMACEGSSFMCSLDNLTKFYYIF